MTGGNCPACVRGSLVPHCPRPHPTCNWSVCSACRSLFDLTTVADGRPHHGHPIKSAEATCRLCHPRTQQPKG